MPNSTPDLIILHEHPEWQKPLFAALERRGIAFEPLDVTRNAFTNVELPRARLYFNQASPSAYIRGNTRAVPRPHPGRRIDRADRRHLPPRAWQLAAGQP